MTVQDLLMSAADEYVYIFIYGLTSDKILYEGTIGERPNDYDDEALCSYDVVKREYEGAEAVFLQINIDQ